jgi:rhodanese-related sulfurtransferase
MIMTLGKHGFSGYLFVLFTAIGLFVVLQHKHPHVKLMSVDEAVRHVYGDTSVVFLDVRNLDEWNSSTGHLRNGILIPLQDLRGQMSSLNAFRNRLIIVYCRSGNRSGKAARLLSDSGFNVVNLAGGIREWNTKKYPVLQEKVE